MKTHLLLVLISLSLEKSHVASSSLTMTSLVDMLQKLCPGVNVCQENQTTKAPVKTFLPGFQSCCTECSCGPDCKEEGNCCFPQQMDYAPQDDGLVSELKTECLFATTSKIRDGERFSHLSYSMVSSVPQYKDGKEITINDTCGDVKVAPWGSLYPVYSEKKKRIYKNIECAIADSAEDGKIWDSVLVCDNNVDDIELDASSFVLGIDSDQIPDYCRVDFIYKGRGEDIRRSKCYVDLIDSCSTTEFEVFDMEDLDFEKLSEACTSGLVSPFRRNKLYVNVFCHICNGEFFSENMFCQEQSDYTSRGDSNKGIIGLLDGNYLAEFHQKSPSGDVPKNSKACFIDKKQECREVFCPSGQLRDWTGECKFPHKLWYDQDYVVYTKLTADDDVDIKGVFNIGTNGLAKNFPDLKSPMKANWNTDMIYDEEIGTKPNNTYIVLVLRLRLAIVQPQKLIADIKRMINKEWTLMHDNKTYILKSSLMRYRYMYKFGTEMIIGNRSETITRPKHEPLYVNNVQTENNMHFITKLYLCKQVELNASEFILSQDKLELLVVSNSARKALFESEFSLIVSRSFEAVHARICIEESGMFLKGQVERSMGQSIFRKHLLLPIGVTFLYHLF